MAQKIINGILLDEQAELTLNEICCACKTSAEWVIELVEEGAIEPIAMKPLAQQQTQWRFSAVSLQKVRTATRLQRDLGINLAGIALALELIDEINSLESHLRRIEISSDI